MKIKVKGLVFVGFAAAVFAQSAMAEGENKIVTSKQYVDSKIVGTGTGGATTINSTSSDTNAPSMLNVYKFVTGQIATDAVKVAGDGTYNTATFDTSNNTYTVTLQSSSFASTANLSALDTTTNDGKLATAGAVKGLLDTTISGAETDTVVPTSKAVVDYAEKLANKATAIVTDSTAAGYNSNSDDKYPTTKAVYDYVTGVAGNYQPKLDSSTQSTALYIGKYDNGSTWKALEDVSANNQASTDYVTIKADASGVYQINLDSGHIAATSALTGAASNDTGLVTAGSIRSTILQAGDTAGAETITTNSASDVTVPTTKNVYDFVAGYAQDNYQPKILDTDAGQVMIGYNTQTGEGASATYASAWKVLDDEYDSGAGYVHFDTTENSHVMQVKLENVGHAGTDISGAAAANVTAGTDKLASAYAVQEYVQSLLHGNVLPAAGSDCQAGENGITSNNGKACALVMSYDAASSSVGLKWIPMAQ